MMNFLQQRKIKRIVVHFAKGICVVTATLSSGCASLIGKWSFDIPVNSSEPGTRVDIYSDGLGTGNYMNTITTPATVRLKPGGGWTFWPLIRKPAVYRFEFSKEGYINAEKYRVAEFNYWTLGNIAVGGLVGLIIDSHTGACCKLSETQVYANLSRDGTNLSSTPSANPIDNEGVDTFNHFPPVLQTVMNQAKSNPLVIPFRLPESKEEGVDALPRESLVGKWAGKFKVCRKEYYSDAPAKLVELECDWVYEFGEDGKCSLFAKDGTDTQVMTDRPWTYVNGWLTIGNGNDQLNYRVDWLSEDQIAIRWRTPEDAIASFAKTKFPGYITTRKQWYDDLGCQHLIVDHVAEDNSRATHCDSIATPEYYLRQGQSRSVVKRQSSEGGLTYQIVSCERESGSDFAYRFVLALKGEDNHSLSAFRKIQKEFREAVKTDYAESFPGVKKDSLFVEFSKYKLEGGKIEGRAVVLTIAVASLTYDPNTRTGKLAVKVNANQYEEARKWIRKNIETLARDKNIALTTGEIPPAAKFYLGKEELKDGNVLEIEFKTE